MIFTLDVIPISVYYTYDYFIEGVRHTSNVINVIQNEDIENIITLEELPSQFDFLTEIFNPETNMAKSKLTKFFIFEGDIEGPILFNKHIMNCFSGKLDVISTEEDNINTMIRMAL